MFAASRTPLRRRTLAVAGVTAALTLALSACGGPASPDAVPGMDHDTQPSATASPRSAASGMPGMQDGDDMGGMAAGDGLSSSRDGYRLTSPDTTLPAGRPAAYRFTVYGPDGKAVTDFAVEQTKRMHFYAIRSDLTGYQHVHSVMADDGTWTADLASLAPGSWRLFASFTPGGGAGKGQNVVLSRTVTVPGRETPRRLPQASATTTVDGYTVTVKGNVMAGMAHPLTVTIGKDGTPVRDLQPYLDTYAHLTAFHQGDRAFAHLHPEEAAHGGHGGPDLSFHAALTKPGNWRLFLEFRTEGTLHTAALTLHAA